MRAMTSHPQLPAFRVAVVGGGINGIMAAWSLRKQGCEVVVLERGEVMSETSSASTKLLHGGLRYLEHGSFRLVREALAERAWWLAQAPHLCHPIELLLPIKASTGRPKWMVGTGLWLYELLAGRNRIRPHRWLSRDETLKSCGDLRADDLLGSFAFWDGQMDDLALGRWAADRAREAGVRIAEHCVVDSIGLSGDVRTSHGTERYDLVVNVAGPWASELLDRSGIQSAYRLDLVRGSHLVTTRPCAHGILAQVPGEHRIGFVLPWKGGTLIGTTEVRQQEPSRAIISQEERDYIRAFHNSVMASALHDDEISGTFAGLRPLIRSAADPSRASREYAIERQGNVVTIFGGKWTTARALGERIARQFGPT